MMSGIYLESAIVGADPQKIEIDIYGEAVCLARNFFIPGENGRINRMRPSLSNGD